MTEVPSSAPPVRPPFWLVPLALLCVIPFLGKAPVLDEESYLWIGAHLNAARPYDWLRIWQPYDADDSFIYAHPPLYLWWMAGIHAVSSTVWIERLLCAVPFVSLYAWAVAIWAARSCRHPGLAAGVWLASSTVQLGLQDSLMIDLPAVAFVTMGLAMYRTGLDGTGMGRAGAWLGLAMATKYSMAMVCVPVVLHAVVYGRGRAKLWALVIPMVVIPCLVEGAVYGLYGRVHVWEVWAHRGDIVAGPLDGRLLGTFARLALLPLPIVLILRPGLFVGGAVLGLAVLGAVGSGGLSPGEIGGLAVSVALGGGILARSVAGLAGRDGSLLGGVVLCVIAGVAFGHNYASARYLLPAAAPLAILLTRSAEAVRGGRWLLQAAILVSGALALAVSIADFRFARASAEVADHAIGRLRGQDLPAVRFAGEWSFRYTLEDHRITRYRPGEVLPEGAMVVVAGWSSPGEFPRERWEPRDHVESTDRFPLRVMGTDISLYAETLGILPLGFSDEPLESATIYRVGPGG